MKKKDRQRIGDFDREFDEGKASIDFRSAVLTKGLSQAVKLPPMSIPA